MKPSDANGYSSRIPTRGAPRPLHRGQRLGKSWDDKVIQAPMEKSVPLIPIHEIIWTNFMARHEEDVLEPVEFHIEQNRCVDQGGGHGTLVCVDQGTGHGTLRVVILVRIVGCSDSSHRVVVFTDDASHLANRQPHTCMRASAALKSDSKLNSSQHTALC